VAPHRCRAYATAATDRTKLPLLFSTSLPAIASPTSHTRCPHRCPTPHQHSPSSSLPALLQAGDLALGKGLLQKVRKEDLRSVA